MSIYDTDYNSGGNSGNNSGSDDFEDRANLKLDKNAAIQFSVSRLDEYGDSYGQKLIVDMDDVEVLDGILMERSPGSDDDNTVKIFSWGTWFDTDDNGQLLEDVSKDDVPTRHAESFGSNDYSYELVDAVQEGGDTIEVGNLTGWFLNQTKYRTFAKVFTPQGHNVVADKEDDYNWLATDSPAVREDLQGRRVTMFFAKQSFTPDDQDEPVEYTDAVLLDANSGAGITIANGSSSSGSSGSSSGGSGSVGGSGGLPDGVPEAADDMIDFLARTEQTDPDEIETVIESEVGDASYDLEAVVDEIESRQ
jgi:hypothetical protein